MRLARSVLCAAVLAIAAAPAAQAAELLVNGSFEDTGGYAPQGWGGFTYGSGYSLPLPGWTVNFGSVDITTPAHGGFWGPAADGANALDINGWDAGQISQSFNTVLGRLYTVSFDYSRNVAGAPDPATALVSAGGVNLGVVAPNDASSFGTGYNMKWKADGFTFVGDGSPTTLSLTATVPGNGGVFFDKVSVTTGVPEPAAWTLMIAGFGLAGAALRRRRAIASAA